MSNTPPIANNTFTHGSLFSGIGGFDLASSWCGWQNVFQVEIDEWCLSKLAKNFPNTKKYNDIKVFNGTQYKNKISVLSGGFPCQPFSVAGKGKGIYDERNLWSEMFRVIKDIKPLYIVAENVPGIITNKNGMVFNQVHADLESENYKVQAFNIPVAGKNAHHKRNRIWFIAHATFPNERLHIQEQNTRQAQQFRDCIEQAFTTNANGIYYKMVLQNKQTSWTELRGIEQKWSAHWSEWGVKPTICGNNDGISNRLDRIRGLGNSVSPILVYDIFRNIELTHTILLKY